jgi:two-component system, LytTR family, response regulator
MLTAIIVDDEALARQVLREYLGTLGGVEVIAECPNGFDAVKAVTERPPDLLFLDIQMPKLDGFEVLELLGDTARGLAVIFVTAYDEYALRAFDVHAVDYLLKPFAVERLGEAVAGAGERGGQALQTEEEALASAARRREGPLERVLIRDGAQVHVLPVETIDFVEAQDDYAAFHAAGKNYLKEQTLAELESRLDPARFVRVHRSFIVNVERIARVELYAKDSRIAILRDGRKLPVSRAGYSRLQSLL